MNGLLRRGFALLLVLVLVLSLVPGVFAEEAEVTVLFTHDLHSHLLPATKEEGGEYGGYARLMTAIRAERERNPHAILVDGGDFSMGSLFQTAYPTSATELRIMGAMGYDATTFGNHDFDYLQSGLADMLNAAVDSGDALPALLDSNYLPPKADAPEYDDLDGAVWEAMDRYGVKPYILMERGGVWFAIFGVYGYNSHECSPQSGMLLEEPAVAAQRCVDEAVAECLAANGVEPIVVALSHSGTSDGAGEDVDLASAVTGIDLIVSGHTHTTLTEPIRVGDTYIVSAGEYGKNLGVADLRFDGAKVEMADYRLIPIDETVADDAEIAAVVEQLKQDVQANYLDDYGFGFDEVLLDNPYKFDNSRDVKTTAHESTLGNLIGDAYKWAAEQADGETVDVALTAAGVIRETIPVGKVTVSDMFNMASLGVGTEGELVSIWLTGKDLMTALEVDASVYPLMHSAQLFFGGVEYSFNQSRMIFNKVDYARLRRADGTLEEIQPDKLYRVVTGMYAAQMLGNVEATSMGLLSVTPLDREGNPIDRAKFADYVVRNADGVPLKEWYAIASYMDETMEGTMSESYAQPDGRKVIYSSLNPVKLLKNPNKFTFAALGLILVLVLTVVVIVRAIRRRRKK